jgi:hypothetical protein
MSTSNQFQLLGQRRYGPFFWALFLGSLNDSLLKYAVVVWLTYKAQIPWLPAALVGSLAGALVMLPSVLLSATSGQMGDRWPLHQLIKAGKTFEVAMMALGAWGLWTHEVWTMLTCVVLSGVHVTLFSTLKYAYLPRYLDERELVGGNGMMEMGMFSSILLGTLLGGLLAAPLDVLPALPEAVAQALAPAAIVLLAVLGRLAAGRIPQADATDPSLRINLNPISETWRNLQRAGQHGDVVWALMGISWMWFYGALFLTLFPAMTHDALKAQPTVVSLLLMIISLGIGAGSLTCERLARGRNALALVPLGALGMAVFGGDLARVLMGLEGSTLAPPGGWPLWDFMGQGAHQHLMVDLWLMAMSVGWFSVPLYAQMQAKAEPSHRARVVGANNIINALFMLVCAAWAMGLGAAGLSVGRIIAATVLLHGLVCLVAYWRQPRWRQALSQWRG